MARRWPFAPRGDDVVWLAVSLLTLVPCLYYPYLSQAPGPGFTLIPTTWQVVRLRPCPQAADCPRNGDRVLAIDGLTFENYRRDRSLELLAPFADDGRAAVRLVRGGVERTVEVRLREGLHAPVARTLLLTMLPVVFWLMGTALVLFLRPRNERWLVMTLFSYVVALVLASGMASARHAAGAAVVFHAVVWMFLPVAVHLHLLLPSPLLGRGRRAVLALLYGVSLLMVALDANRALGGRESLYDVSFVAGVALSLGLLGLRLALPASPAARIANRIMAFGVAVGFAPVLAFFLVLPPLIARRGLASESGGELEPWLLAVSLLAMPILPLSYLYAIYKHAFSALEFRANRLLGVFAFLALWAPLYVVLLVSAGRRWGAVNGPFLTTALLASVALVTAALLLRARFQALVDRYVFDVRHTPEEVVRLVSARIPSAFDRGTLARVVLDEILPALLVRQSALYLFEGGGGEALYEQALPETEGPPDAAALRVLLSRSGAYLPPPPAMTGEPFAWVRLVLPLALQGETIGAWLIGRRDPDDHFPASDIHLLATVANQIAPALESIRLYERAQQEIAQRKAAEEEIRRTQQQVLHAEKMEAIGRLSAGMAHDFNNCLVVILGYADLLLADADPESPLSRHLTAIQEAGQKATALTKELLAFARRQAIEARVVDCNRIVTSVEKMLRRLLGDDVVLVTELDPEAGNVRVDPGRLEHVLVNLAVNARHAMPHGGRLTVHTAALAVLPERPAPHAQVPQGRYVLLTVTDTGVGMDAATRARVFEPFFSTRRPSEGTGLGLSTAYGFIQQSGGHIFADSAPGRGARFSIYLPVVDEAAADGAAKGTAEDGRGGETVLVVEDEPAVRTVVVTHLQNLGYRVLVAESGREALAEAERHAGPLHLLLTDVTMPGMSGRQLARRLLTRHPATRVLYMSGQQEGPLPGGAAAPFLQKPFSARELGRAVRAVFDDDAGEAAAAAGGPPR